jgi:enamine deaminase RidA (YjgF/YER057c/UK114 family)
MTLLSAPSTPAYLPVRMVGDLLFVSGQLPIRDGQLVATGIVGAEVDIETAADAAAQAARLCLKTAEIALGSIDGIAHVVKVTGYVAATADFVDHAVVIDAASRVFTDALGAAGEHARAAIGVASLPMGASVEVEAIFAVRKSPLPDRATK